MGNSVSSPSAGGLAAVGVSVHFAGLKAVDGVDLSVAPGEILGLIGPNGAGKTTFLNAVSGFERLKNGAVWFGNRNVTSWPPHKLARVGIVRTFQNVRLFGRLTVAENVEAGVLALGLSRRDLGSRVVEALQMVKLADKMHLPAASLPGGTARQVSVARAIASRPSFLLLDEPAAGLNEDEGDGLIEIVNTVRNEIGCGIVLIEHDMRVVMGLCDRVQVLNYGRTICIGSQDEVRADAQVQAAYLGDEDD